ncbi:unnamed protein product [Closterium sp. NIES-65]|nr:unnamed protein product [Closterium sp. NIES-65]
MKDAWDTIIDKEFWTCVGTVLDVLRPVYKLLRIVDGNQEVMGKIYDKVFVLEDAVKEACKELTEEEKEDVTDIVQNRWNNDINCALHVSIHTARRNRLGAKRLPDLVYVSHNYHTVKKLNEDLAKKLVVSGLPVVQVKEEPTGSYGHLDDDDIPDEAYLDGHEAEEPME